MSRAVRDEVLIAVDERDRPLGPRSRASCHQGDGILHRAFSVYLFGAGQRLLLQRRSVHKPLWPRYWANSCCSHPRWGETTEDAARRRVDEELGLRVSVQHLFAFRYQARFDDAGTEHELCHVFAGVAFGGPAVDPREAEACVFVAPERLDAELERQPEVYTPWLALGWRALRTEHWHRVEALLGASENATCASAAARITPYTG